MITKIKIDGFKSFSDFEMEFSPLTVIAGTEWILVLEAFFVWIDSFIAS